MTFGIFLLLYRSYVLGMRWWGSLGTVGDSMGMISRLPGPCLDPSCVRACVRALLKRAPEREELLVSSSTESTLALGTTNGICNCALLQD